MATKKQRKRRAKERRHEWEYVLVDEEGREIPLEEGQAAGGDKREAGRGGRTQSAVRAPGGRTIEPPSWGRVFRRAGIFGPLILIVVYLLRPKGAGIADVVLQAVILLAFFIPFSYLMDSLMYRMARKRVEKARSGAKGAQAGSGKR